MTATVTSEIRRGPLVAVYPNGRRFTEERLVITVDDWRDTIIGRVNFGHVQILDLGPVEIKD
jgi:hypothetical protein